MKNNCLNFLRTYYNKSYINDDVIPFKGLYQGHERYLYVYVVYCIPTKQYYVGQHVVKKQFTDPLKDGYKGSGVDLKSLILHYNWYSDFSFKIIEFCHNADHLLQRELYWIDKYKEKYPNQTINLTASMNLVIAQRQRRSVINLTTGKYYRSLCAAARAHKIKHGTNIRNAINQHARCDDCFWIYAEDLESSRIKQLQRYEDDFKLRLEKSSRVATADTHRIEVQCIETGEIYSSIKHMCQLIGRSRHYIMDHLYTDGIIDEKHYVITKQQQCTLQRRQPRPIINLCTKMIYSGIYDATKALHLSKISLISHIKCKTKLNGNYWCYVDKLIDHDVEKTLQYYIEREKQARYNSHASRHRRVLCETTGEIFETTTAAAKAAGYSCVKNFSARMKISNVCKDRRVYRYLD